MLQELTIKNIVLIEKLNIEFPEGFTVFSGETGAGKSIIFDALGFVLGAKQTAKLLKYGTEEGYVIAKFYIDTNEFVKSYLKSLDIDFDDYILIRRSVNKDNKTKAYINDIPVTSLTLKDLSENLIEICGQHEQRNLFNKNYYLNLIDGYAGNFNQINEIQGLVHNLKFEQKALKDLEIKQEELIKEEEYLQHALNEINELDPREGEEKEISDKKNIINSKKNIIETIQGLNKELNGKFNVLQALYSFQRLYHRNIDKLNEIGLDNVSELIDNAINSVSLIESDLEYKMNAYFDNSYDDEQVELRLMDLKALARKFRTTVDDLPALKLKFEEKLKTSNDIQSLIRDKQTLIKNLKEQYFTLAGNLSEIRKNIAKELDEKVSTELTDLNMGKVVFKIDVSEDLKLISEKGYNQVNLLICTNNMGVFDSIEQVASGGELSRIMLALKISLLNKKSSNSIIFDEIDTGVGGKTAYAIGKKLKALSKYTQVFVVTHQPQVAALSDNHILVEKFSSNENIYSNARLLNHIESTNEIARMLSGEVITEEAISAAKKLQNA